jgi:hypothetical protein
MTQLTEAKPLRLPIPWPESAEIKVYTGGCHCKKIRYEFEHPDIYTVLVMARFARKGVPQRVRSPLLLPSLPLSSIQVCPFFRDFKKEE